MRRLETLTSREFGGLCEVLIDCVEGGASVSFMHPMTLAKAADFWREVAASMARGERALLVAEDERGAIIGTGAGRRGRSLRTSRIAPTSPRCWCIGARAGSASARQCSRPPKTPPRTPAETLLVLDTASDDAERLYERRGWQRVGTHSRLRADARRRAAATPSVYYKRLD